MPAVTRTVPSPYEGPACPRCNSRLTADWIVTGTVTCPDCSKDFEAVAFHPAPEKSQIMEIAAAGPEAANACANHTRNAAVTSCLRCGLFICALCEMNVGSGSYCPSCFDRLRVEGTLKGAELRTRNYRSLALTSAIWGFLLAFMIVGGLLGVLSLVYASRARKQLIARDEPTTSLIIANILAVIDILGAVSVIVILTLGIMGKLR